MKSFANRLIGVFFPFVLLVVFVAAPDRSARAEAASAVSASFVSDTQLIEHMQWVGGQTGLTACEKPPNIVFAPSERLTELHFGPEVKVSADLMGLYDALHKVIYLKVPWSGHDLRHRSTLIHELVHHLQQCNGVKAECAASHEREAFRVQLKWLNEQGVSDPHALLGINDMTIFVRSLCLY